MQPCRKLTIEQTDRELRDELMKLMIKAKAFDVALQHGKTNQQLAILEQAFATFSKKKQELVERLNQIHGMVPPEPSHPSRD